MRAEIETLEHATGGWLLRFRTSNEWDFKMMVSTIKSLPRFQQHWEPQAFNQRGGWWLAFAALDRIGPYFCNWLEMKRLVEETTTRETRSSPEIPAKVEQAFAILHLRPTAPVWVIQAVYKAAAKRHHPDAGGSHEAMKAFNAAYEVARAWAECQAA